VQLIGLLPLTLGLAISGSLLAAPLTNEPPLPLPLEPSPLGTPVPLPAPASTGTPGARRPDIVMFYLDDFSPRPRSLWEDSERTPNLARFVNRGTRFSNGIVSTPLCGPSRAGLLTGRYGHNTGVIANDVGPYRSDNDIADKLSSVGYRTVFVGKHINRLAEDRPTRLQMERLAENWDEFDVMWEDQGKFYDWLQYRKDDAVAYGADPDDHSSRVAAARAVEHIAAAPDDEPLFLLISLVDGHIPITPMRRHLDDPVCASIEPWRGPAFNEDDVADKPAHIQATPKLPMASYDLTPRCEQSLTVDWVVGKVTRALRDAGRLDDTLQILTADNGWLMGDHRLEGKTYPYATSVPLYMQWPAVIGNAGRRVKEPVSNVDLGRTFCALAGCAIPKSNGRSLLPLIKGTSDRLEREFLYVEMLHANRHYPGRARARPAWAGVETTLNYSDTLWAFTRYQTGEEELYDLSHDPHRLKNLVGKPAYADVRRELRGFWKQVWDRDGVHWKGKVRVP
jgi:N-acetylglucosamine-6-sulfatase